MCGVCGCGEGEARVETPERPGKVEPPPHAPGVRAGRTVRGVLEPEVREQLARPLAALRRIHPRRAGEGELGGARFTIRLPRRPAPTDEERDHGP